MPSKGIIVKNTFLLYIRMFFTMGVSIITSRIVLDKLGVDDYSLYNVVGGLVGMFSFLSNTLSTSTSRFLTYALGTGDKKKLHDSFVTSCFIHLALAILLIILIETLGLWFMNHKLVIPTERLHACFWVLQISVITTFISVYQVPYTASIMATERMGIYAYISIFESLLKLGVCYVLMLTKFDKLILYAALLAIIQILITIFYIIFCRHHFYFCRLFFSFDKPLFKEITKFSGWSLIAHLTETLKQQGVILLINMFLAPTVVAAQSLANQISTAMLQFVNNFRLAINPQIIKSYASGHKDESKELTLNTTVYCFDLILLLGLPCLYTMDTIMSIWLVRVPDYAVSFTRWIIVYNIIYTFGTAFYIPMLAANKIRTNSIASIFFGFGQFAALYIILKNGGGPMWVQYCAILMGAGFSFFVKPYILWKEIGYSWKELLCCYWVCFKVLILSLILSLPLTFILKDNIMNSLIIIIATVCAVVLSSYVCLSRDEKAMIILYFKRKFNK